MSEILSRTPYAAPPEVPPPAPRKNHGAEWQPSRRAGLFILGGLGTFALLVLFGLPRGWEHEVPPHAAPTRSVPTPTPQLLPEPPGAREAAQDALAGLLDRLEDLQARGVARWGEAHLGRIEAARAAGETHYRAGQYTAAQRAYAEAETAIASSLARLPVVVAEELDVAERALRSHQPERAREAFTRVLAIDPDNRDAERGVVRATHWHRVLALLTEAEGHRQRGDDARARASFDAVLALAPGTREAILGLQALQREDADKAFRAALSRGYAELARADYTAAIRDFEAARKLRPTATEPLEALASARRRAEAAAIARHLARAQIATSREAWSEAERALARALAIDPALASANLDLAGVRARATLDTRLARSLVALKDDQALSTAGREKAHQNLAAARRIVAPGPRLKRQIADLTAALARAPMAVTLISDGRSEVTLEGQGPLGRFSTRTVSLPPGRYTAQMSRPGSPSRRIEFTVTGRGAPPVITLRDDGAMRPEN
jgi:tetratricopeptide (TPR) repeat protein